MIAGRGVARARAPVRADKAVVANTCNAQGLRKGGQVSLAAAAASAGVRWAARAQVSSSVSPFSDHRSRYEVVEPLTAVRTSPEIADLCFA